MIIYVESGWLMTQALYKTWTDISMYIYNYARFYKNQVYISVNSWSFLTLAGACQALSTLASRRAHYGLKVLMAWERSGKTANICEIDAFWYCGEAFSNFLVSYLPFFAVNTRSVSATCGSKAIPLEKFLIPSFSVAASVCFPGSMSIFFGRVSVVGRITILRSCFQHKPVACRLSFWNQFWSKRKLFQHVATLIQ